MSTAKFNTWLNPDGTENYKARAWVNFNGTGTVAIRAAGNVSSITDGGTGVYTVNFTTAMPDANYAVTTNGCRPGGNGTVIGSAGGTTSGADVQCRVSTSMGAAADESVIMVSIFR